MIEEILFDDRSEHKVSDELYLSVSKAIKTASNFFDFNNGYQVSVSFVDKEEIKQINLEYRNVDSVTDVLSFPLEEEDPRGIAILGDIVLCYEVACEQAKEYGHSVEREVAYLSVHSFLHLMGYDHMQEEEKSDMRAMEKEIMNEMKIYKSEVYKVEQARKEELLQKAREMRNVAYCPYSNYQVGAAIMTASEKVYTGCNIENASYPAGICAERTAAVKAISEGERSFKAVAVAVSGNVFGYPCGVCRQFLNEFMSDDGIVLLTDANGNVKEETFKGIFPSGFKGEDMD